MDDRAAWLRLIRSPGLPPVRIRELVTLFGGAAQVIEAKSSQLARHGVSAESIRAMSSPDGARYDADLAWLDKPGNDLVTQNDSRYPALLSQTSGAPGWLFVSGDISLLAEPQLAMVGSRNPTANGTETAHAFARHLAGCGLVITSGLALGIDAAAHRGALDGGGSTIAVLGSGPDVIYPARNRELADEIARNGCLVTEHPPGTEPRREHFPSRNRIIAGLALGTLVVEAAQRSGSLITARLAGEAGREILAIPGSIHNPLSRGCHRLIKEGAKLVESADDVLIEISVLARASLDALHENNAHTDTVQLSPEGDDPQYRVLLDALTHDPTSVDTLITRTGLTADVVSSMLLILELQGQVATAPGGRYVKKAIQNAEQGQD